MISVLGDNQIFLKLYRVVQKPVYKDPKNNRGHQLSIKLHSIELGLFDKWHIIDPSTGRF